MDLMLSITGSGGDTTLDFEKDKIGVSWNKSGVVERRMIAGLVKTAGTFGLKAESAEGHAARVPGFLKGKSGSLVLKGDTEAIRKFAKAAVESEVAAKRIVMSAQKDGTWKILKSGEYEAPKEGEKQAVTTKAPVGGG